MSFRSSSAFVLLLCQLSFLFPLTSSRITAEDVTAKRLWSTWSTMEKLDFLLYPEDWYKLRSEFERLDSAPLDGFVTLSELSSHLIDSKSLDDVSSFHAMCEKEGREEEEWGGGGPSTCNFDGYVKARGFYDASGNAFDAPEWEMREGIFRATFHDDANRPDITPEELELLGINVGPDGIIVD